MDGLINFLFVRSPSWALSVHFKNNNKNLFRVKSDFKNLDHTPIRYFSFFSGTWGVFPLITWTLRSIVMWPFVI